MIWQTFHLRTSLGVVLSTCHFCCLPGEEGDGHPDDPWDEALKKVLGTVQGILEHSSFFGLPFLFHFGTG